MLVSIVAVMMVMVMMVMMMMMMAATTTTIIITAIPAIINDFQHQIFQVVAKRFRSRVLGFWNFGFFFWGFWGFEFR